MSFTARRQGYLCLKDRVGKQRAAALLATALLAVAAVAPAHATDLVGATAGELGVSPAGSASYSIPVAVLPGTTGLQPKITLQYDSLGGNGPAGMGWSIGGLATITRCPTSLSVDGTAAGSPGVDPVDYDGNDKLCLNGQRLVPVVGAYGAANTEYRTYQDEFSKILSIGTQGPSGGPQSFRVWRKSGEILEFGFTADSRIEALGRSDVWAWALNKLSDTYGNYETFTYSEDTVNGGYRISRIDYTGNAGQSLSPYNHIDFIYAARPDDARIYEAQSKITVDKRLTNIKVYADASLFRDYQITYETAVGFSGRSRPASIKECAAVPNGTDCFPATTFQWSPDGQKTLTTTSVTTGGISGSSWVSYNVVASGDFNGDGRTDLYLAKTDTHGQAGPSGIDHVWLSNGTGGFQDIQQTGTSLPQYFAVAATGDFNGDGLTDLYAYRADENLNSGGLQTDFVQFSNGTGGFARVTLAAGNHSFQGEKVLASGDFNGDGLTDLFLAGSNNGTSVIDDLGLPAHVLLGGSPGSLHRVNATGITVSSYNGFSIPSTGDFNGDGLTDMYVFRSDKKLRKYGSQLTDRIWLAKWIPSGSGGSLSFDDQASGENFADQFGIAGSGDFNGDGLTDFYVIQMDPEGSAVGNVKDHTWLATGTLDFDIVESLPISAHMADEYHVVGVGDFTGDGLTDLYVMQTREDYPLSSNGTAGDYIVRSKGDGTFDKVDLDGVAGITGSEYVNYQVKASGDFDGDGLSDLYLFNTDNYGRSTGNADDKLFSAAWKFPDQLAGITNGLGLTTELAYKPLTNSSVYTKGTGSAYPVQEVMAPRYVIAQVKADDGLGGHNLQTYSYEALRAHLYDIGNLGFAKIAVVDWTKGIATESTYSQAWAANLHGLLVESRTKVSNSQTIELQTMAWSVATGPTTDGTPRLFRYLQQTTTAKNDLNTDAMGTVTETALYDNGTGDAFANYGFPSRVTVTTAEPSPSTTTYTKITNNTYQHTESNWQLGRLLTSTVTHQQSLLPDIVRSSAFTYNNKGVLASETVEPSNAALFAKKAYAYDGFGAVTTLTETWGSQNNASIRNAIGGTAANRITTYQYDGRSRYKTHESNPLSHTQDNSYDPVTGTVTGTTGPNGLTTSWPDQDAFGRPTREIRADGTYTTTERALCGGIVACPAAAAIKIVSNTYGSNGAMIAPTETVYQDKLYREVRKTTLSLAGTAVHVDTIYDGEGRIAQKSEPFFNGAATLYWTTIQYDKLDRPVLTTRPDGSTQSIAYNGLTQTSTNELGQQKTVKKDALGRSIKVIDDAGTAVLTDYDALGEPTLVKLQGFNNTGSSYGYDIRGNKLTDSDPDKGAWSYSYNALGLVASQSDAKGQVTTMTYDLLGRMLTRIDDATAANPQNRTTTWIYDAEADNSEAKGKLTEITGPGGYFKYILYDTLQREYQLVETIESTAYTTSTSYEQTSSRVASVSYPSGYTIANVYNAYGHLASITDGAGAFLWRALADDARGNITDLKLGTQVRSIRAYDNERGWLKSIVSQKVSNSASLQDLTYSFNALGNLTRRSDHDLAANQLAEVSEYDPHLNRLTKSTVTQSGMGAWSSIVTVQYDDLGNITAKSDIGTYTYGQAGAGCGGIAGGRHAVTTIAGTKNTVYCYDRNGNMVSGDGRTITYTPYDLPQTITRGFSTVTFSYDPERQRYKRVDSTSAGVTTTIYAAGHAYEKITRPNGTIEQKYYIGGFAVVTRTGTTDTVSYLLGDHLGSVDTITNANGLISQKMSFDAWGKRREAGWMAMADPSLFDATLTTHGFTGHEEIDPVGLIHMNGRVYDPEIGRFLSADPFVQDMSNSQNLNRYTYVLNNPLSLTDPTGYFFGSVFKAIGNFIGKVFSGLVSAFKAALKIPLIRGIIQIVACSGSGPLGVGACIAAAGALTAIAGGSLSDAIQAMAFASAQIGAWWGTGTIIASGIFGHAAYLASVGLHGVVGGALSLMQGGSFLEGLASGAFSEAAQPFVGGLPEAPDIAASAIIGGTASVLAGGKFANGALTAAFATMYNDMKHPEECLLRGPQCNPIETAFGKGVYGGPGAGISLATGIAATLSYVYNSIVPLVHGNALSSTRDTYVYDLEERNTGEILKYGITSEPIPEKRYTSSEYLATNSRMNVLAQYQWRVMARAHEFGLCGTFVAANGRLPRLSRAC
jgi:RHS repeat-associated protein